jgi:hypothetical protein
MNITESDNLIIDLLLKHEHQRVAEQLHFIKVNSSQITSDLLNKAIALIDRVSRLDDIVLRRIAITLCAILWTYRTKEWVGLKDFLLLVLSRMGFPPSTLMIDEDYDSEKLQFSGVSSLFDQFTITCYHLKHEVIVGGRTFLLTEFQKNIWSKIEEYALLGISAPTSAGKSFIILLKCIEMLLRKPGNVVYIVPTLSLVFQVSVDFRRFFQQFELDDYEILTSFYERPETGKAVYVLTQEKAIAAFSQQESPFTNLRFLIVDEIQNVERVADEEEQRAKTLYDALIEFRHACEPERTIISGPRIEGIGNIGTAIFGVPSNEQDTKGSPVVNFTYAISKVGQSYYFRQYTDIRRTPSSIPISYSAPIEGHGGVQYRKKFHGYLLHIVRSLGPSSYNIIFSPKPSQARRTAVALADSVSQDFHDLQSLIEYIASTVHPKYDLCYTLSRGIAYHHGKTPLHIRRAIEKAIREKMVKNVVCTTTLMQGVNLPAQTVIIRNPYLYVSPRFGRPKLTNYEIANLRGRAGRLLKDFIGRTYVLDENSFEDTVEEIELFTESRKELHPGYGDKFLENEEEIIDELFNSKPPSEDNHEYSFLLTYIRQIALKYKDEGIYRLRTVGIDIQETNYRKIQDTLLNLSVPIEVCFKNRYWDPFDLDILYHYARSIGLPISISEPNITGKLMRIIKFMADVFPLYSKRYFDFNTDNDRLLQSCCINAEHWLKEWPIHKILNTDYFDSSDKIEHTVGLLQNKISFGLPMLLKPIYDIKNEEAMFLRFIEMGAFRRFTRRMIELNIPRETAIMLSERYFDESDFDEGNIDAYIRHVLKRVMSELSFWDKIQLESVI